MSVSATSAPVATPDRLAARVEAILTQPDFPAFSQQIVETMRVLEGQEVSAHRLAEIVSRNYGLTLKVLRAANSFGSNPAGVTVFDLAQAIFRLGIGRVRSLAGGMVFFEHFHAKSGPVQELVVLSLVTANQAHEAAERIGLKRAEEAYLCAMLRNMGEVLVASYFPGDYERIQNDASRPGASAADAARRVLGFAYDDLGVAMAEQWKMPSEVHAAMTSGSGAVPAVESKMIKVTRFAHSLTTAMLRSGPGDHRARVALVVDKHAIPLGLSTQDVEEIAEGAVAEARQLFARLKVPLKDVAILDKKRVSQALGKGVDVRPASPSDVAGPQLFARLEGEVDALLRAEASGVASVVALVLTAMQQGAGFDRVLFGLVSPDRTAVQGRLALGAGADGFKDTFSVSIGKAGGPMGMALARQQDLLLRADWDLRPDEEQQMKHLGVCVLGLLPMTWRGTLLGCLYYDRGTAIGVTTPELEAGLRRLRDRCVQMLSRSK